MNRSLCVFFACALFACTRSNSPRTPQRNSGVSSFPRIADGGVLPVVRRAPAVAPPALPPPGATASASNPAPLSARPAGATLTVPAGFRAQLFADRLDSPRNAAVAPDGRLFVVHSHLGIVVSLRDADGDGVAEQKRVVVRALTLPFGIAFHPSGWLYIANTNAVVRYRFLPEQPGTEGPPEVITELPGEGYHQHWTRNIVFSQDGRTLFVSVGSETNVDAEQDERRGAVLSCGIEPASRCVVYAGGLRNPVGLAIEPRTGVLLSVVNERDELGDELVPDYFTRVWQGAFYGWPYAYFGQHEDPRRRGERPDLVARTIVPDLSLGAHVAPVGLLVLRSGPRMPEQYAGDVLVSLHGSWNRSQRVGYKVVRVRLRDGVPTGEVSDFVTGWMQPNGSVFGRPAGLVQGADGTVFVMDDAGEAVWRVLAGN